MGLAGQQPTNSSQHAALIDTLRSVVETLPDEAFTSALINYLLFPVTTVLRTTIPTALPDGFLESAFRLLALVVRHWRTAPAGIEVAAWEQLWRFAVAAVSSEKGKGREVGQEVNLQAISLLSALLEPHSAHGIVHPTPVMRKAVTGPKAPLTPTLFQTVTLALDCATPLLPHPTLQRAAVRLLGTLITYLAGQSELLASVLPGIVSALTKAVTGQGKNLRGDIAADMAGSVKDVIVETLDDDELRRLKVLRPAFNDLSDLADVWEPPFDADSPPPPSPTASQVSTATSPNPFPPLSASYLAYTAAQLQTAIPPMLSTLTAHTSHLARIAAADLSQTLIKHCHEALPRLSPPALSTLLLLSNDEFDPVRIDAMARLKNLMDDGSLQGLDTALVDLLSGAVNSLPRLIRSQQDIHVDEVARLVTAIAKATKATGDARPNAIAAFLGPAGMVERWGWSLLDCLEFGRPRGWSSTANTAQRTAELGWGRGLVTSSLPLLIESSSGDASDPLPPDAKFPHLSLRHVETERTVRDLAAMLESLGAAGGEVAVHSVDYFIRFAKAHRTRDPAKATSAVWVSELLLKGVAAAHEGGHAPKAVRKMAREVARVLVSMDDEDDEDDEWEGEPEPTESDTLMPVERTKGLDQLTTLLDRNPLPNSSAKAETRRLHARAQRVMLSAVSLTALSSCAHILGTGFRPLLLHALYVVLAHLSSPHDLVRQFAEVALVRIAYDTGYASAQNLVLDNVDYVVNVVSQRLTYHRLSAHAPLVLIAMIRLVGAPIVPLVHDVVDEIFDALDDFHGYAALASALLAVLTTLIDAMATDVAATGPTPEREAERNQARRFLNPPDPTADFARFQSWYAERSTRAQGEMDTLLEQAPRRAWGKQKTDGEGDTEMEEGEGDEHPPRAANADPDEPPPPTRTQEVATQILEKATYYLSHASPFLRARVLSLIAHAVPVLAQGGREGDLLPLINKAWPSILDRLDDPLPYVAVEAAEVVASLSEYVGDYVSKRITDDAWPRLRRLLRAQSEVDKRSALARRGAVGTTSEHTVSHRLHVALLRTATFIASDVPVKDSVLWDMMLAFRPLLDRRAHGDLQKHARVLYIALATRDGDALWVALHATMGTLEGDHGVWDYLHDTALDITANATAVLADA